MKRNLSEYSKTFFPTKLFFKWTRVPPSGHVLFRTAPLAVYYNIKFGKFVVPLIRTFFRSNLKHNIFLVVKPLSLFAGICSPSLQKHTFSEEKPPTPVESLYRILFYNMQSYSLDDLTNSRPPSRVSLYLLNVYHKIYYIVKLQYSLPKWKI